jgi:TolA-binding protein
MTSEATDVSSSWYDFLGWLDSNKRNLMFAGAGVLAVVFALAAYRWKVNETEQSASDALLRLKAADSSGTTPEAGATAADYLKVAKDFPGTSAADRAQILAAGALYADGKYADAQAEFERFGREHAGNVLATEAAFGVASALEAQGKREEALTAYQAVQSRYPKSAQAATAKLGVARIYEQKGQLELALKSYEELARPGAAGGGANQAMQLKQHLLAAHPELAVTNSPALTATNAPAAATAHKP